MTKFRLIPLVIAVLLIQTAVAQTDSLLLRLKGLPHVVEVTPIKANKLFKAAYRIVIDQPLDHNQPNGKHFHQRVFLSHNSFTRPMVFVTEGYQAEYAQNPLYAEELARLLDANQIVVEHRYFGNSVPSPRDWKYLNITNAAADHHLVATIFKALYPSKWVSTGISKGGQTSIYFRYFYPQDVDATVAYVAPINFALEDPREIAFLKKVGSAEVREKILQFQKQLLMHKQELLPLFEKRALAVKASFSRFGLEAAFDQSVLEYPFSYWQWGHQPSEIPSPVANNESLLNGLCTVVQVQTFGDGDIARYEPFFAQANSELGYYGYDLSPFRQWLTQKSYPNTVLGPQNLPVNYSNVPMHKVDLWLKSKAERLICIYGGFDPWSASAARIDKNPKTLKEVAAGGSHASRILSLDSRQQSEVFARLKEWLGMAVPVN